MANKIVVQIPSTVVTANGTTVSEAVAMDAKDRSFALWSQITARTDGSLLVTVQLAINADGPWVSWFSGASLGSVSQNMGFASVQTPLWETDQGNNNLLFIRLSAAATSVTSGFTFNAALCAQG